MKQILVYASKHGTTTKIAEQIKAKVGDSITLFSPNSVALADLEQAQTIVIGGSIHMGKIQNNIANFCKKHAELLLQKEIVLFLCCMDFDKAEEQFSTAFPLELREHSICNKLVGGEFLFDQMNFLERAIIQKISGKSESTSQIDDKQVNELIATLIDL